MDEQTKGKIESLLKENKIILFMKGEPNYPMCGFSAKVVDVLNDAGISFNYFNILEDGEIREGIKEYGNWPTLPQLYSNGKLIGGCDIIIELEKEGELKDALGINN